MSPPLPSQRQPLPAESALTFVACRCGVDMEFDWPRGREDVRCFGCGARFHRPAHLPSIAAPPGWNPRAFTRWSRSRRFVQAHAGLLTLLAVATALLVAGLHVWLGSAN